MLRAVGNRAIRLRRKAREFGIDVDRTGNSILAEQRTCGPRSTSDILQIRQVEHILRRAGEQHTIKIDADAAFQPIIGQVRHGAQATNIERGIARIEGFHGQAGDKLLQLVRLEEPTVLI